MTIGGGFKMRFTLRLFLIVLALLFSADADAQLSGPLYGTIGPGIFDVTGYITVPLDCTLTMMPGTTFRFPNYNFTIYGDLIAVGTETDSIRFIKSESAAYGWYGLNFNAGATGHLEYCLITESKDNGISLSGSSPTIRHCTFLRNDGAP
jgi:hypothetical protein